MEDDERDFGDRIPRRQLVYPFLELYDQQVPNGRETANVVQPSIDELL